MLVLLSVAAAGRKEARKEEEGKKKKNPKIILVFVLARWIAILQTCMLFAEYARIYRRTIRITIPIVSVFFNGPFLLLLLLLLLSK